MWVGALAFLSSPGVPCTLLGMGLALQQEAVSIKHTASDLADFLKQRLWPSLGQTLEVKGKGRIPLL